MGTVELSFGLGHVKDLETQQLESYLARLNATWDETLEAKLSDRTSFRARLVEKYGTGLDAMTMLHECAVEAADCAADAVDGAIADDPENATYVDYYQVIKGLMARVISSAGICWRRRTP